MELPTELAGTTEVKGRMNEEQRSILLEASSHFPPPQGAKLSYEMAGFRADASILRSTVFRVGILVALRSLKTQSVIGLMITASHNKVSDNGVKVADPSGRMLTQEWEPFTDAPDPHHLLQLIVEFVNKENIPLEGTWRGEVLLARDTRPSGESLLEAAKLLARDTRPTGISSIVGASAIFMGVLTTPQLHWMVRAKNKGIKTSELEYFEQLSSSFRCLVDLIPQGSSSKYVNNKLLVDGANGVGGEMLEVLKKSLIDLDIETRNSGEEGVLNEGVGADYVQKEKVVPCGFGPPDVGTRCASLDGDADRLVYFRVLSNSDGRINLVDGDKMLSLFALFINEQLSILNEAKDENVDKDNKTRVGVVQTAYANGASTDFLKQLGIEEVFTPTGVKYLHEKAAEYDIGIYFEANGHETVLFSENFLCWLEGRISELSSTTKGYFIYSFNSYFLDWVKVVDRTAVVTANAETVVVRPLGVQEAINAETAKYDRGRCFIRPSGTEDVIRVYAEASTQEAAESLASSVARLVDQFLGFGSHR
ncbi:hypothetical protein RJ640_007928 [Escallonia rubra]|uniref:Phosphoacetylglucosamine mutase n=1 Tax=Escallonia rubra TaxID=112253 RepID=A0AA88RW76_9ASTE|nr:hypothetical protein RJ640_007928 [Escallonia rubra]